MKQRYIETREPHSEEHLQEDWRDRAVDFFIDNWLGRAILVGATAGMIAIGAKRTLENWQIKQEIEENRNEIQHFSTERAGIQAPSLYDFN